VLTAPPPDQELLVTTDLLVENSHFNRHTHPPDALGHKALARGLSDIAAMGGQPLYALLSLCLPPWTGPEWQKHFLDGLFQLAEETTTSLVGGDLSAGERFTSDIIIVGSAARGRALRRARARVGDVLYVSGHLGGSALGLERLHSRRVGRSKRSLRSDPAVHRHLWPRPRLSLGRFLAGELGCRAAMDLSDGLSIDLFRLTAESGVGAEIWEGAVPVFPGASLKQALHGGEDYELLFSLPRCGRPPAAFDGVPITAIGVVTKRRGLALIGSDGRRRPLPVEGFQHTL